MWKISDERVPLVTPLIVAAVFIFITYLAGGRDPGAFIIMALVLVIIWFFDKAKHNKLDKLKKTGASIVPDEISIKHKRIYRSRGGHSVKVRVECKYTYNDNEHTIVSNWFRLTPAKNFVIISPATPLPDDNEYSATVYVNPDNINDRAVHLHPEQQN